MTSILVCLVSNMVLKIPKVFRLPNGSSTKLPCGTRPRLIYVLGDSGLPRHANMDQLIQKVGIDLVRKRFNSGDDLNAGVYASLVNYLMEKEIIRTGPFDASFNDKATLKDLEVDKIKEFVHIARAKRGFPLQ